MAKIYNAFKIQVLPKKHQIAVRTKPGTAINRMGAVWTQLVQLHQELQPAKEK